MKSQMVTLKKSQKLLAENLHERLPIENIQKLFMQFQRRVMQPPYWLLSVASYVPKRRALSVI